MRPAVVRISKIRTQVLLEYEILGFLDLNCMGGQAVTMPGAVVGEGRMAQHDFKTSQTYQCRDQSSHFPSSATALTSYC